MRKLGLIFIIIFIASVFTVGCTNLLVGKKENILHITPVELFTGNEQKYRALIPYATAYKLDYKGEEREIIISTSIWDGGELVTELGSIVAKLASNNPHLNLDNSELLYSIEHLTSVESDPMYIIKIATVGENGYSTYRQIVNYDSDKDEGKASTYRTINNSIELRAGDKANIIAYQASRQSSYLEPIDLNNDLSLHKNYWLIVVTIEIK